jgi:hypothetical protein
MKKIINFVRNILDFNQNNNLMLGRWSINYCSKSINKKIDSGNEDHCGPCGQYNLKTDTNTKTPKHHDKKIIKKIS